MKHALKHTLLFKCCIILLFHSIFVLGLTAQGKESTTSNPKIFTGIGVQLGFPLLSKDAQETLDATQKLYPDKFQKGYISIGLRIPFLFAFELASPYSLGFGAYIFGRYQNGEIRGTQAKSGNNIDIKNQYRRSFVSISPVFYNQLDLAKMFILSLAVGPSFGLSFNDKFTLTTSTNGNDNIQLIERENSSQLSIGLYFALGFQYKFIPRLALGFDLEGEFFFMGHKAAISTNSWTEKQFYLGSINATISLFVYL